MTAIDIFTKRNEAFASGTFAAGLKIMPSMKTLIVGCLDPRVEPADLLGLEPGEAAVIRNIGGRITPDILLTMKLLRTVSKAGGGEFGAPGWNLVILHHTDCGITRLHGVPDDLSTYLGVGPEKLESLSINDPHESVAIDVAALRANPNLPGGFLVSGLVYDVATGKIETVVAPAVLRA